MKGAKATIYMCKCGFGIRAYRLPTKLKTAPYIPCLRCGNLVKGEDEVE